MRDKLDRLYKELISIENLNLAWSRLKTTRQNIYYKNYYRKLYSAYDFNKNNNLKSLSERLKNNVFIPSPPTVVYIPKSNGLHRPFSFLCLEDLIVYQAMANIVAELFRSKRKILEHNVAFGNILSSSDSIYFFKRWEDNYKEYKKRIANYFNKGNKWVSFFDLAAYYDTIDHGKLLNMITYHDSSDFKILFKSCLETWSSPSHDLNHGIPQGPIASNILGEIYLLPIDEKIKKRKIKYVRYMDDIKIMGKTKEEVLYGIMLLERECKEVGLVPNSKKFTIFEAKDQYEAIGKPPSLTKYDKRVIYTNPKETYKLFKISKKKDSYDISKIKYILKASKRNTRILNFVKKDIYSYPDLSLEFSHFLLNYKNDPKVSSFIYSKLQKNPPLDEFVEGIYWELLSKFKLDPNEKNSIMKEARQRLIKNNKNEYNSLKFGLQKFLCSNDDLKPLKYLDYKKSCFVGTVAYSNINYENLNKKEILNILENSRRFNSIDNSLLVLYEFMKREFEKNEEELRYILNNDKTGILGDYIGSYKNIDYLGILMHEWYDVPYSDKWKIFLGDDYDHAKKNFDNSIKQYKVDINAWINYIDSFNEILTIKFIELLNLKKPDVPWPELVRNDANFNNKKIPYGKILYDKNEFSKIYPDIRDTLYQTHQRRCKNPISHSYDDKTLKRNKGVSKKEQKSFYKGLKKAYKNLIEEAEKLLE